MTQNAKTGLLIAGSLLAIMLSGLWIYSRDFRAPKHNVKLHRRIGEIMAEQTAQLIGAKGNLVLITIPTAGEPELKTQLEAFRQKLKKLGDYEIKEHELDLKDQAKYALGSGLSGGPFVRTAKNNPKAN